MSIENANYIHELNVSNPKPVDPISEGDNHIRLIKKLLTESFPSDLDGMVVPNITGNEEKYLQVNDDATEIKWKNLDIASLIRRRGELQRPWFQYINSDILRVHAGLYDLDPKDSAVHWNTSFDKVISHANGWRYLYLNESSISGNIITSVNAFEESGAVPVYNEARHGWYNGENRCIFIFYVSGGALTPFYHDGSTYVEYRDSVAMGALTSSGPVTVRFPPLGTVGGRELFGEFTFHLASPTGNTNGSNFNVSSLDGPGHFIGRVEAGSGGNDDEHVVANRRMAVYRQGPSTTQIYVIKDGGSAANRCTVYTNGYYLPRGM
jgi:hypothetical protein